MLENLYKIATNYSTRTVCGIVIESQRFFCALPFVGGIDVSCWWGVSPLIVYFFLFGGGDVWVLRIHPWRSGIQALVLLEMVRSVWSLDGSLARKPSVDLAFFVVTVCILGFLAWTMAGTSSSEWPSSCIFRLSVTHLLVQYSAFYQNCTGHLDFESST